MRDYRPFLIILILLCTLFGNAQQDSITVLDEVILTDVRLLHFSSGKVNVLKDSLVDRNGSSLTDLLQFNSSIYLKENGLGMISSPSFRGTNASQTAVIWNGININSQLTGQVDFNTIVPRNYGSISIRSGGGSVQFGSGAIGGSIHLNDVFRFNKHSDHELLLGYGSFDTKNINYRTSVGSEKTTIGFGVNYQVSNNDYKYLDTDKRNENGAYENVNINGNIGHQLSEKQLLKFYHNTFIGDRDFSGTITAPSNSNYKDINVRNLLEWSHFNQNRIHRVKAGYLYEKYKYFDNKDREDFSFGNTNTFLVNYDYKVHFKNILLNGIADYSHITGDGTSIENVKRKTLATTFLFKQNLSEKISYGVNLRKEFVNDYNSPLVYGLDVKYVLNLSHSVHLNASKNYRIPTFNEIYWVLGGGSGGNPDVKPESSLQAEIGYTLNKEKYTFHWAAFYIASEDLIQWRPNNDGIWTPTNINDASNYGLEVSLKLEEKWGAHHLSWKNGYGFTKAMNNDTENTLMYVPEHKANSNLSYAFGDWLLFYQLSVNGSVFITSDNSESLPGYSISNLGVGRNIKTKGKLIVETMLQVNNLFNKNYQNVAYRPMPNRNVQLKLKFKI
ncbi:TonB-dependent receptor plug domain-containing protein [Zobellia roscoffensis]|uniref:TonB-dependent receptor plug domain-containing protein n=1 Tax=Zobellia roscoffensis TaxID=2779508 RepID=UPI00188B0CF8|nr:TonB-dependent receptor [Zobellia roscoffensis]